MKKLITVVLVAIPLMLIARPIAQALEAEVICERIPITERHINNQQRRSLMATSAFKIRFNDLYINEQQRYLTSMLVRKCELKIICPGEHRR